MIISLIQVYELTCKYEIHGPYDNEQTSATQSDEEKLDSIIETMRDRLEEHIEKIKNSEDHNEEVFMNQISDMAKKILAATHTIEEVTDKLIQSIEKRDS